MRNEALEQKLQNLLKLINGHKSERYVPANIPPEQLNLFNQNPQQPEAPEAPEKTITYTRKPKKHPGRNQLPEHLPVEEVIIEPEQDISGMTKIGEEISETLHYTPASLVKRRTIRPKYAKADGSGIVIGKLPTRPLEKAIAEASLLAFILTSKYVDHLPLYRQAKIFARDYRWQPAQSTLGDWVDGCCRLLEPLYNKLKQKLLDDNYIQVDESPIKVLDKDKPGSTHQGYQWVYQNPIKGLALFHYRKGRGMAGPKEMLENYQGYLQCDGYGVYDKIGQKPEITLVGCLAHARRKFFDAQQNDKARSQYALEIFGKIYSAQREIDRLAADDNNLIKQQREEKLKPLLEELKSWIENESLKILPKSAIGKAMTYYQNQYPKLTAILYDGRLKLDNNLIENAIRPLALGRKNYLFAGSHKGAQNAAMLYSFFATCKINHVNPRDWLTYVLEKIPDWNIQNLEQLLPNNFSKLSEA